MMQEFVQVEGRNFKFKIGSLVASSLSGFLAGVAVTSVFWALNIYILSLGNLL